jgi:hypothetical protein
MVAAIDYAKAIGNVLADCARHKAILRIQVGVRVVRGGGFCLVH